MSDFPAAAYDAWKSTEPDHRQHDLGEQRCRHCDQPVPVTCIVQHPDRGQICEDCANELDAESEHNDE